MSNSSSICAAISGVSWLCLAASPTLAQNGQLPSTPEVPRQEAARPVDEGISEIIVTARKREETSLTVPVALTAVTASELNRRSITTLDAVGRVVPQLIVAPDTNNQGGVIAIRGISGPANNIFGDQAVAFNIDGI